MRTTHDIGTHFWYTIKIAREAPFIHDGTVYQGCYPYQWSYAKFIRIGFGRALVIGNWKPRKAKDVSAHLVQTLLQASNHPAPLMNVNYDNTHGTVGKLIRNENFAYGDDPERMS